MKSMRRGLQPPARARTDRMSTAGAGNTRPGVATAESAGAVPE
jgi:hypothetical protein